MRVAFSSGGFEQIRGGISRYFSELIRRFDGSEGRDFSRAILPGFWLWNEHLAAVVSPQWKRLHNVRPRKLRAAYTEVAERFLFANPSIHSADLIHETFYPPERRPRNPRIPRIVTVHDMIHEKFPSMVGRWPPVMERKKRAISEADAVISVSQHTKADLLERFNLPEERVTVVPLGTAAVESRHIRRKENFFLFVGRRDPYKNFPLLVESFGRFINAYSSTFRLVLFGGPSLTAREQTELARASVPPDSVALKSGSDSELSFLYQTATALVVPSLYEGFGLPCLEAMAAGCPVIVSNVASLPEVAGSAGNYFSPDNAEQLFDAMVAVSEGGSNVSARVSAGLSIANDFTWDTTFDRTVQVYASLL